MRITILGESPMFYANADVDAVVAELAIVYRIMKRD